MFYIELFIYYIIAINIITFIVYGVDKLKAKKGWWRIPEADSSHACCNRWKHRCMVRYDAVQTQDKALEVQVGRACDNPIAVCLTCICLRKVLRPFP